MKKYILSLLLILCVTTNLFSQNNYSIYQFQDESIEFVQQPIKWEGNDWLKLGIVGASTFLVLQADQPIRDMFKRNPEYIKSAPIELGRMYGELYSPVLIAGIFGLHGLINENQSSKKIGFEILQTTLYAGVITTALKLAFGRSRPFTEDGSNAFGSWSLFDDQYHSFPSGHATIAFAISTVLSKNAKTDFLKIIAYLPAVLAAVSRVYQGNHWASDVFLGAVIGYSAGEWVTSKHDSQVSLQAFSPRQLSLIIPLD